ncbi:hypothetical protein V6582_16835 [Agrobacterium vitis]|uniref:hypothetical protein n=1 Tax=Agrobacterium vitis TaxID=373 RepID=UPI0013292946|nr:hypothetical protein [Agrobacterium vitis]MVA27827.1 hypothetical protein [Agrobacterium vitis]
MARQASTDLPFNSDSKNFVPELSSASQKCIEMNGLFDEGHCEKISGRGRGLKLYRSATMFHICILSDFGADFVGRLI